MQTYLPLYRKYRPQSFADLVGQSAITTTLINAIAMDRVAHAYLFCGPRGTGKTSTARIFAKSLNCEQGPTATPCQVCATCTGITQGQALDVIEFDAASNNGVGDARELIESCQFAPLAGRYKIYIIDEVHMLTSQAFNALLKTLEEPPERVVFIFATTEAHKVLPTIVSRCQRFDFSRIRQGDLEQHLGFVAQQEGLTLDATAITLIARAAKGGLRDALSLLDQVSVLFDGQTINADTIRILLGGLSPQILFTLTRCIAEQDVANLLMTLQQLEADGVEPGRLLQALTEHWRDLMLYAQAPSLSPSDVAEDGQYAQQISWFSAELYPQMLGKLSDLQRQLRQTQQPQLWLEIALVELAHRHNLTTLSELKARIGSLEAQLAGGVVPAPVGGGNPLSAKPLPASVKSTLVNPLPAATVQAVPSPITPSVMTAAVSHGPASHVPASPVAPSTSGDAQLAWQTIIDRVASPAVKGLLKQQTFLKLIDDTRLVVACSSEAIFKTLEAPEKQQHVAKAVEAYFGHPKHITMIIEKPSDAVPAAGKAQQAATAFVSSPVSSPVSPSVAATVMAPAEAPVLPSSVANTPVTAPALVVEDLPPPVRNIPAESPPLMGTDEPLEMEDLQASKANAVRLLQAKPL
jgi:DNA polymerase III subunit gamma/tau